MGVTIVVITHEMKVIEQICGRVAVIDKSRIVEEGTVTEVFTNPKSRIARELILPRGTDNEPITPAELTADGNICRLVFNGASAYEPIISSLAIDAGVKANILSADMRNIDGLAHGSMLISLDSEADLERVKSYVAGIAGVTAEEVEDR